MRRLVLGTAGHIDHGKTSLVRALTGVDTDRLPDEKRRGITIDLGFASLPLPDGGTLSIVDVPGHEAFIRNMLAGATGIDLVLFVIAADEGPMPQTREHLAIIDLLGIRRGVIALTKSDLVEPEWLDLVKDEVTDLLAGWPLAGAPIHAVSATTGAGIRALADALDAVAADVPARHGDDLFRMPIDRVFTVRGTGTVVTGTVWSGSLRRDAQVRVLPAGINARVRGLQQHGADCAEVGGGARAAVALSGIDRQALTRGDTLLVGEGWEAGRILTVDLQLLRDASAPLRNRQRVRVHVGTAEVLARLALSGDGPAPGENTLAQLRLEEPIIARTGDHLVVRSYSPVHTIAGGIVLEAAAPKRKKLSAESIAALTTLAIAHSDATSDACHIVDILEAAVVLAGPAGLEPRRLPIVAGLPPHVIDAALPRTDRLLTIGGRVVPAVWVRETADAILARLGQFHERSPMLDGMEREALQNEVVNIEIFDSVVASLVADGRLVTAGNALALPSHAPVLDADGSAALAKLATVYRRAGLEPPDLAELPHDIAARPDLPLLIRFLERDGTLLRLSATRLICAHSVSECVTALRVQMVSGQPLGVTDFKDVLKLTRKHLIPLLEHFDRTGVTRRTGEIRILAGG